MENELKLVKETLDYFVDLTEKDNKKFFTKEDLLETLLEVQTAFKEQKPYLGEEKTESNPEDPAEVKKSIKDLIHKTMHRLHSYLQSLMKFDPLQDLLDILDAVIERLKRDIEVEKQKTDPQERLELLKQTKGRALEDFANQKVEEQLLAVELDPNNIIYCVNPTPDVECIAIKNNPLYLNLLRKPSLKAMEMAVELDSTLISSDCFKENTREIIDLKCKFLKEDPTLIYIIEKPSLLEQTVALETAMEMALPEEVMDKLSRWTNDALREKTVNTQTHSLTRDEIAF